jgi:D-alanyl-D-alanine carboxypeptidase
VGLAFAFALAACSSTPKRAAITTAARSTTTVATTTTIATVPPTTARPTTAPAPTTTAVPTYSGTIANVSAAELASSWHAGCPVGPASLRLLHMSYWGFDNRPHSGAMVVNASVATAVVSAFARMYAARVPIRRMVAVDAYGSDDHASMAADNTSGFNCRYVAGSSPPRWSAHAFGEAIDINTVENPYVSGSLVSPPAGNAYLDRSNHRPGMAGPGTALNDAFAAIGWLWGGRWASPDYQHFSKNGG